RIEKIVQTDVALMYIFVKLVEQYIPELKTYELGKLVREFERSIFREIDFRIEADNTETLTSAFTEIAAIRFPQVFHELSSEKVLTLTFIQGHKIQDVVKHRTFSQTERNQIANTGAQAICKQIFEDGFFHADPHSGNLLIQDDGGITFLDAGMVGHLSIENRRFLSQILIQIVDRNANGIITACLNENILPDSCDIGLLREDIDDLFVRYYGVSLKRIDLARSLSELFAIMFRHKVHLPSSFLLLMRTLIILEGVGVQLNPEFNPVEVIGPYARRLISHLYTPKAIASDIGQILKENIWTMRTLPGDLSLFIQRLLRGKTEIKLDHRGLDQLNATIDKAGSRFSAAILIAGIIVSSSLIMHAHIAPLIGGGTSILGLIGFLMAFVFAIRLITSIWKDF
ncbi:AarF/ABC1/UbiB kinase family protein, partial [Candidatus Roizmanbacteria bacterium]|nr:AarF/ABC1/UbiB kinase family protein [Candidatus Roizmanbacteria bacterium]